MRLVGLALLVGLLAACGGGGGNGASSGTTYQVTTTAQSGGSITPSGATVPAGRSTTFTITASPGFAIGGVTGCGGTLSGATYTTASVTAGCTVAASFVQLDFHVEVAGNAVGGLVLENNGAQRLAVDTDGTFTFSSAVSLGDAYSIRIAQQPVAQVCRVANPQGAITLAPVVVSVQCVNRVVQSLQMTLRTSVDTAGTFQQFLYVRSPRTDLHHFRVRPADGGLDEVGPLWRVTPNAQTFVFSPSGSRAFADDGVGNVSAATVRDADGVLVPVWTTSFGSYAPTLPVLLTPVRPSADDRLLYRNVTAVVGGFRYQDLWVGTVSDTGVSALAGSPFAGSDGGGPALDATERYLARRVAQTGSIEIYGAFTAATQTPALLGQGGSTFGVNTAAAVLAESAPGTYLYETTLVSESGTATGQTPGIAVHSWQRDGSLEALGGVLTGQVLTGEIVNQVCTAGGTSTSRVSAFSPLLPTAASSRILVQRQDTSCTGTGGTGLADSRVLGVYRLTVTNGQAAVARLPLDSLAGWADLGGGGAMHPKNPWLYLGSKHAQRIYAYSLDPATGAVQALAGSPFDGQSVPSATTAAIPGVLMDPLGKNLYMTRYTADAVGATYVDAFSIDQATGALTAVATYPL